MTTCQYCKTEAKLLKFGDAGYPYRRDYGQTYVCIPCAAWVGCHKGTTKALGSLANAELREAKIAAHAAFDPLWQCQAIQDRCTNGYVRRVAYKWLSKQLGYPVSKTHIGYMSLEECHKVIEVCSQRKS